ncbi:MAG: class I SAM-dependent methyltransferase [Chloroflexota bacterium]
MAEPTLGHNPFEAEALAAGYDAWFKTPLGAAVDRLERALIGRLAQPRPGERALDVGTGTGHYAGWLARGGLTVTGLDSSAAMLNVARAKGSDARGAPLWVLGDAAHLPYADGAFDLVLSVTALEFMPAPERALDEMWRVTASGGRLVVAVLNADSAFGRAYLAQARQEETPFRHAQLYMAATFLRMLGRYGKVRWNSSVFFWPTRASLRGVDWLERLGRTVARRHGALLVGRVDK